LSGLASVITAELIGRVLEHNPNSYTVLFVTAACLYPAAMLAIQALSPRLAPAKIMPVPVGLPHRTLEDV
jgi:hypothetical protein